MKQIFLTILLLAGLILSFYGQDTIVDGNSIAKTSTGKIEKPNAIFVAPINLFDFVNPNFQIGYERFVAKKWVIQLEAGIIINHSIENYLIDWLNGKKVKDCPYTNKGFRIKTSVKYIVLDKRIIKLYVSPELFYMWNKTGIVCDFVISDPNFEYSFGKPEWKEGYLNMYSQFLYNDEKKMGINFKFGIKLFLGKRFLLEPHVGIGLAYRIVSQTGRENPNDELYSIFGIFDNAAPNKWVPTLPINLKIGCRF